jgi:preprotein translocase subunit SecA
MKTVLDNVESQGKSPPDPYHDLAQGEERQAIYKALAALVEHEREVSVLFFLGGYPQRQVADFFGVPLTAVKKRIQRAKANLRRSLGIMAEELFDRYRPSQRAGFRTELVGMIRAAEPRKAFKLSRETEGRECLEMVALIREEQRVMASLKDSELTGLMARWRNQKADNGATQNKVLRSVLPEVFAAGLEALKRLENEGWPLLEEDGKLLEVLMLDLGQVVEMENPQQRFATAALTLFVNALDHPPAHLLLSDDSWLATAADVLIPFCQYWGLDCVTFEEQQRRDEPAVYEGDIVCMPLSRLGFDYLRLKSGLALGQPAVLGYGLIDGADRLIKEEVMTPLKISRPVDGWNADLFIQLKPVVEEMIEIQNATADESERQGNLFYRINGYNIMFQDAGRDWFRQHAPQVCNVADQEEGLRVAEQLLRALNCYRPEVDYRVLDGRVLVLDGGQQEHPNKRFSDGLHQALEAKEGVEIQSEDGSAGPDDLPTVISSLWMLGGDGVRLATTNFRLRVRYF